MLIHTIVIVIHGVINTRQQPFNVRLKTVATIVVELYVEFRTFISLFLFGNPTIRLMWYLESSPHQLTDINIYFYQHLSFTLFLNQS